MRSLFKVTKMRTAAFAVCFVLFVFAPFAVHAQDATVGVPVVRVQPDSVTVKEGDVFNVSVVIENLPANDGMAGGDFILTWNTSMLRAVSMEEMLFHTLTPQDEWGNIWQVVKTINNTGGYAEDACLWFDIRGAVAAGYCPVNGISGNHTLAVITMKAVGTGSTTLKLPYVLIADINAQALISVGTSDLAEQITDPSWNATRPEPTLPENVSALLDNLTVDWTCVEITPCGVVAMPAQVVSSQENMTGVAAAPPQDVPVQQNVTKAVPMSTKVIPGQNSVIEVQKQDALEDVEVPFVMLAMMSGVFMALPACFRRVRRED